jgi:O-antigen ligase
MRANSLSFLHQSLFLLGIDTMQKATAGFLMIPNQSYSQVVAQEPATAAYSQQAIDRANPVRRLTFFFAVGLVFVRFSMLHQILAFKTHTNFYLLYVLGIPALLGILLTGGIRRMFHARVAIYWMCFAAWIAIAVPFSTWRGGSAQTVMTYLRTDFIMMFVVGGLAIGWDEARLILKTIAAASLVNLVTSQVFGQIDANERVSLTVGTVANSNDFSAHLLFVLPFLLWIVLSGNWKISRLIAALGSGYGVYIILASGSRGAALALVMGTLWMIVANPGRLRIPLILGCIGAVILSIMFLPKLTVRRILSFSDSTATEEAALSSRIRERLLIDSLKFTADNPIFGVGPGQFSTNEGKNTRGTREAGLWYQTHNTLTQIASECGLPGLLFYLTGIISTGLLLGRLHKQVRGSPELQDVFSALFCMRLSMIMYCTAILFLNFGYFFYLPAMAGLAAVLSGAVQARVVDQ